MIKIHNRFEEEMLSVRQEVVSSRERLEEDVAMNEEAVEKAETTEREARAELDAATSKRAELECQAAAAQSEVDTARISASSAQQRLAQSEGLAERLAKAGGSLSAELGRRLDLWDKVLLQGLPAAAQQLEEALAGDVAPTFAQVTCRVEEGLGGQGGVAPKEPERPDSPKPQEMLALPKQRWLRQSSSKRQIVRFGMARAAQLHGAWRSWRSIHPRRSHEGVDELTSS
ncbi:unnamed protein product [Effrenium voratum]|nr:unnamed protein product [Effrenium voratum]